MPEVLNLHGNMEGVCKASHICLLNQEHGERLFDLCPFNIYLLDN